MKQVVDLQYAEGLAAMRAKISNTASYGGLTRGPRLIDESVKAQMREMLAEIRDGRFAQEWVADARAGFKRCAHWKNKKLIARLRRRGSG